MEFNEQVTQFSQRVIGLKDSISTEEATKTSIIMPFFQMLGYDVFNPMEFTPEFTADVGIKKGEKVDYAIILDKKPVILVECKACNKNLDKHCSQLFRYFSVSESKFAVLTNGIKYNFYTDLDEPNKMDLTPFLEIDLTDIVHEKIEELRKFHKVNFDIDTIFNAASDLKYHRVIKETIKDLYADPSDDFIRLVLSNVYHGVKTQNIVNRFKGVVQKSFSDFISDLINTSITSSLNTTEKNQDRTDLYSNPEEVEVFYIIRSILGQLLPRELISYKVTDSYLSIVYNNRPRKWVCRFILGVEKKQLILPSGKNFKRIYIENIQEIYDYSNELLQSAERFVDSAISSVPTKQAKVKRTQNETFSMKCSTDINNAICLTRGQKTKLSTVSNSSALLIQLNIPSIGSIDVDVACFGVDSDNKLSDEQYFIFYNQIESYDGSIKMLISENSVSNIFSVDLSLLPETIKKIIFTAAIDGEALVHDLLPSSIVFSDKVSRLAEYNFSGDQFEQEKAIVIAEIYRKENDWIISIVSQGFNGGLEALLNHFGGETL